MGITIELYRYCIGVFNSYFSRTNTKISNSSSTGQRSSMSRRISILFTAILCLNIFLISRIYSSTLSNSASSCSTSSAVPSTWILPVVCTVKSFHTPQNSTSNLYKPPPWSSPHAPPWSRASTTPWTWTCYSPPAWSIHPSPSYPCTIVFSGVYILVLPSTAPTPSQLRGPSMRNPICPPELLKRSPSSPLHCKILSLFSMVTNFQSRYKMGNRNSKGIKISHWNKGGSFLINKMSEIKNIISPIFSE